MVYDKNWGMSSAGNVRDLVKEIPDHDILCAGFPVQPFSKSGSQLGFADKLEGRFSSYQRNCRDRSRISSY